jgi:glycosyltransferase involved in cell wall biosynthesis
MSSRVIDPQDSTRAPEGSCEEHLPTSVIVCTLGKRSTLDRCLESLLAQGCSQCEILLVLNGPMDEGFAKSMARFPIRLINEPRRGVCIARNRAISLSKGRILAFVDDDVVAHPNWLHELLKGFSDPSVACVTGRVVPEGSISQPEERIARYYLGERAMSFWNLTASDPDSYARVLGDPAGFGCNMAFRRDFLESCATFPEDIGAGSLIAGDESYMFVQVLRHGYRLHHTPSAVVTHYFEIDFAKQKRRLKQSYAGGSAFAMKLLFEEKGIRIALLKWGFSALRRRLDRIRARKTLSSEPQELLSSAEKITAYLRGPWVYWKSRRAKESSLNRS